jgi:Holliday junction DNA helicase RuvB
MLSAPLRSRFSGGAFRLEFYSPKEIETILNRSAKILGVDLPEHAKETIAQRSRQTPRIANYLLRRVRDYAQMNKSSIDENAVTKAFEMLGLDEHGLGAQDINFLKTLANKFSGGPVGVKNIATAMGEDEGTVEEVVEPYLIQLGFIERSPRGRTLTEKGRGYLKK